jgi:hypothetical protein
MSDVHTSSLSNSEPRLPLKDRIQEFTNFPNFWEDENEGFDSEQLAILDKEIEEFRQRLEHAPKPAVRIKLPGLRFVAPQIGNIGNNKS